MRCFVVFGVTLRLLVINISSSSPTINTAAYYQRCVITCETVAVKSTGDRVYNTGPVAALTQAVKPGSESRFLPTPPAFDAPVRGVGGSRRNSAMPFGTEKLEWPGYPMVNYFWWYVNSFWHNSRTWKTDRQTHRQTDTAWRHRPRLCTASRGKN